MEYNKRQFKKSSDQKVLHKIKKHWVVVSTALLMAIGGEAAATHVASANVTSNPDANQPTSNSSANLPQASHNLAMQRNSVNSNSASNSQLNTKDTNADIINQANTLHRSILLNSRYSSNQNPLNNSNHNSIDENQNHDYTHPSYTNPNDNTQFNISPHSRRLGIKMMNKLSALGAETAESDTSGIETVPDSPFSRLLVNYRDESDGNYNVQTFDNPVPKRQKYPIYIRFSALPTGYHLVGINGLNNIPKNMWINPNDTWTDPYNKSITVPKYMYMPSKKNQWLVFDAEIDKNKAASPGTVLIVYQLANGREIDQIHTTGTGGTQLPVNDQNGAGFKSAIPAGYKYVSLSNGETWPSKYPESGTQAINVIIAPNGNVPKKKVTRTGNIDIDYMYNNNLVTQDALSSSVGDNFDVHPYESVDEVPQGYQYLGVDGEAPTSFTATPQTVYINVDKTSNQPKPKQGHINVAYNAVTSNGSTPVALDRLTNSIGQSFDIGAYETPQNIPNGYIWNGQVTGKVPTQFSTNDQTVTIDLKLPQKAYTETINYMEPMSDDVRYNVKTFNDVVYKPNTPIDYNSMNKFVENLGYQIIPSDPKDHIDQTISNGTSTIFVKSVKKHRTSSNVTDSIVYEDADTHVPVGSPINVSGKVGTPIDYGAYTNPGNFLPAGYTFRGYGTHNSDFESTPSTEYLYIKKNTPNVPIHQASTINVQYVNKNTNPEQVISNNVINGQPGQVFTDADLVKYEHNISQNGTSYKYIGVGNGSGIRQFTAGPQTIDVLMEPIVAPKAKGTITLNYSSSDGKTASHTFTSDVGNSFNPSDQVDKYVPVNYSFDNYVSGYQKGQNPLKFTSNPQTVDVKISRSKGIINVNYVNADTNESMGTKVISGKAGDPFTPLAYARQNIPDPTKYTFGGLLNGATINVFKATPQNLTIRVTKRTNRNGVINITYVDSKTHKQLGKPIQVKGHFGSAFNSSVYANSVKASVPNYHFVSMNKINEFTHTPQKLVINVARDQGHITIDYMDTANDKLINSKTLTADTGTHFNGIKNYISGYQDPSEDDYVVTKVEGDKVNSFTNGNQKIVVQLQNNPEKTATIVYYDVNNNEFVGQPAIDRGRSLEAINYNLYKSQIPKGYIFVGFDNNHHDIHIGDGGSNWIDVRKISSNASHGSEGNNSGSNRSHPTSGSKSQSSGSTGSNTSHNANTSNGSSTGSNSSNHQSSASMNSGSANHSSNSNSRSASTHPISGSNSQSSNSTSSNTSHSANTSNGSQGSNSGSASTNPTSGSNSQSSSSNGSSASHNANTSNGSQSSNSGSASTNPTSGSNSRGSNSTGSNTSHNANTSNGSSTGSSSSNHQSSASMNSGSANHSSNSNSNRSTSTNGSNNQSSSSNGSGASHSANTSNGSQGSNSGSASTNPTSGSNSQSSSSNGSSTNGSSTNRGSKSNNSGSNNSNTNNGSKNNSSGTNSSNTNHGSESNNAVVPASASSAASSKSVAPQIITSTSTSVQYVPMPIYEPTSGSSQAPVNIINVPNSASASPRSTAAVSNQPNTTINYVDPNGKPITSQTVAGTSPDMSQYTQNVPSGYRFDRILGTGSLANGDQIATIELSPVNGASRRTSQPSHSEPSNAKLESKGNGSQPVNETMDPLETTNNSMANGSLNGDNESSSTTQNHKLPQTGEASEDSKVSLGFILLALSALIANLGHAMDRRRDK